MSREISAARLRIVRNAGHLVLDEAPESVGGFIAEFAGSPARS
jgi:pimeloyl-ACP methyl ester carboxylesterase